MSDKQYTAKEMRTAWVEGKMDNLIFATLEGRLRYEAELKAAILLRYPDKEEKRE